MNSRTSTDLSRRSFVQTTSALAAAALTGRFGNGAALAAPREDAASDDSASPSLLTPAGEFRDVSRGNPKPHTLTGDSLVQARLTPETWRLEVAADDKTTDAVKMPAKIRNPLTLEKGTALDLPALMKLGETHGVKFLKAMQCLNIPQPLGQGLWEGVPLREVLRLCGRMTNVRRVYYWGFHNNDPAQRFQSSLSYTQAMETPPGELPAFLAYRLNGEPISLVRGGPVRMVIPWAHGFKSIKWLQHLMLTNDYQANDTYALANNDPESHLKTAAYLDSVPASHPAGKPLVVRGQAICGLSGLKRVEHWLRPAADKPEELVDDDPAWQTADWKPCRLQPPPADWSGVLPAGVSSREILGFDKVTGQPAAWPLRYSMVGWSAKLEALAPGKYEVRARAVDQNDFAQPEPRSIQKTGQNNIQVKRFEVVAA